MVTFSASLWSEGEDDEVEEEEVDGELELADILWTPMLALWRGRGCVGRVGGQWS
jgi:hypothetical protein